jgi:hypothetical protein
VSDDRRLRNKLDKLAAEDGGAGPRLLSPTTDGGLTRAILEEIDETILPRTLEFRAPDGSALSLEVANRRLLGIAGPPDGPEGEAHLAPLPPDDDAALARVADALARFAGSAASLTVAAAPLSRAAGAGTLGRSAAAIAEVLGLTLYDTAPRVEMPDPAKGFGAGLARLALAMAEVSGSEPGPATGHDAEAVGRLSALTPDAFARLVEALGPEAGRPGRFLVLSTGQEALFLGQTEAGRAIVALLPDDHAGAAAALWTATREA